MNIPALTFVEGGWCEAVKDSYHPGTYQPRTIEEYRALAPFAVDALDLLEEKLPTAPPANLTPASPKDGVNGDEGTSAPGRDELVAKAVALGIGNKSTLSRWGEAKLAAAIAEKEAE